MRKIFFGLALLSLAAFGCQKGSETGEGGNEALFQPGEGVFVLNEGQFLAGNAAVDYYRFIDGEVLSGVFKRANGFPIGDILQSVLFHNDRVWLVVNNSGFVIGMDPDNWEEEILIEGLRSPRYLLPIEDNKAYLSDLYAGEIHILDLERGIKTGSIPVNGWIEQMLWAGDRVYAAGAETDQIFVLDPDLDQVVDSIQVGFGPSQLALDRGGYIWAYGTGEEARDLPAGLFRIDPTANEVKRTFLFPDWDLGGWPRMGFNASRDTLFFLKNDLFALPIEDNSLPVEPLISSSQRSWYALGQDPLTGYIYLGDAGDFQQSGEVVIHSPSGVAIDSFITGVIPNGFWFY